MRRHHRVRRLLQAIAVLGVVVVVLVAALIAWTWVTTHRWTGRWRVPSRWRADGGTPLESGQVPTTLATALIDTEDAGFLSEPGISPRGIARVYFHRPLDDLKLTQYALLAGLPQAPI